MGAKLRDQFDVFSRITDLKSTWVKPPLRTWMVLVRTTLGSISKGEVLQLANYLTLHGTGLFGLIVTRVGLDHGAEWTMREQWMLCNKLIVVLTDDDMRQMLSMLDSNDEPEKTIRQKIEDFRLDL